MVSDIEWGEAPPAPKSKLAQGLTGTDAYLSGKRWGQAMKAKHTAEDVQRLIRKIGAPKNDHDRGVLEGISE